MEREVMAERYKRALDALEDMVFQHCTRGDLDRVETWALSSNENAIDLLVEEGRLKRDGSFWVKAT